MGSLNDALKALADEKFREMRASIAELSKETGSTEDTLRKQLSTLKSKGYADGNSKEGWAITPEGRAAFERKEQIPLTAKDVGSDPESKLKYYGGLAGVTPDIILATVELIITGDSEDLEHVWKCMTEMDVPIAERRRWFALYRNHLKLGIPPNLREQVGGASEETAEGARGDIDSSSKDRGRDYIIIDDSPVFVGAGQGDMSLKDAKDVIGMRALKARFTGAGGSPSQGWGIKDLTELIDKITEKRGEGSQAKIYALEQGEQGAILKEVKPGEPLNLNPPGGGKTQPLLIIDNDGVVQELKPGLRIGSKPSNGNPPPAKFTLVRQTDTGIVKEEHNAGDVIILGGTSQGSGGGMGVPFPVFDSDGKPVTDSQGRPVYANLDSTLKVLGWRDEQRRANERHEAIMGLAQTAREKLADGIDALREAAAEVKGGSKAAAPAEQVYQCGSCKTQFKLPTGDWQNVVCPNPECKTSYTREQVMSV
jgi:hypothetical protein